MYKLELVELFEKLIQKFFTGKKAKVKTDYETQNKSKKFAYRFIINSNRYQ